MEGLWLCRRALESSPAALLMTPNAEMLAKASKSKELAALLSKGDILFPDGVGIHLGMKRMGIPTAEKSCGIELCQKFFTNLTARKKTARVFLLGGREGVAKKAAQNLQMDYGCLDICGVNHGYFDPNGKENDEVIRRITESRAEILLVCMGFPRQEKWMTENRHRLPSVHLIMGLGGSLDVWSGNVSRAPKPIRDAGFEWAYRALNDPSRIARLPYLADFVIDLATFKMANTK